MPYRFNTGKVAHKKDTIPRTGDFVKWLVLDFTLLLQTVLKCVPRTMAYRYIETADCHKQDNRTANCPKEDNRTADCHSQEFKFESRLSRGYSCWGKPWYIWERFAKGLFLLWQTALHLRAVCQAVIPVVANSSIGARLATTEWNPIAAILHRQSPWQV
jgi:hypothetical protein